uniref:DNA-directed RNA polymerase I subunit rpa43 n=1 Tax=Lygus hesperus TaxID=30085 RepID=A0A0A9X196_LYGHE
MRYNNPLKGVILAYDSVHIPNKYCLVDEVQVHQRLLVKFRLLVFRPRVGICVVGRVHKVDVDHINVLVYGIFNASIIASTDLPTDFVYQVTDNVWRNPILDETIGVGTVLYIRISKILHSGNLLAMECSLIGDGVGLLR